MSYQNPGNYPPPDGGFGSHPGGSANGAPGGQPGPPFGGYAGGPPGSFPGGQQGGPAYPGGFDRGAYPTSGSGFGSGSYEPGSPQGPGGNSPGGRDNKALKITAIVAVVIVALLAGFAAYWFFIRDNSAAPAPTSTSSPQETPQPSEEASTEPSSSPTDTPAASPRPDMPPIEPVDSPVAWPQLFGEYTLMKSAGGISNTASYHTKDSAELPALTAVASPGNDPKSVAETMFTKVTQTGESYCGALAEDTPTICMFASKGHVITIIGSAMNTSDLKTIGDGSEQLRKTLG